MDSRAAPNTNGNSSPFGQPTGFGNNGFGNNKPCVNRRAERAAATASSSSPPQ